MFYHVFICVSTFRATGREPASASGAHTSCSSVPVLQSAAAAHVTSTPHLTVAHHDHRTGEHWRRCRLQCLSFTVLLCFWVLLLSFTQIDLFTHKPTHKHSSVICATSVSLQVQVFLLMEQELTADEDISRYHYPLILQTALQQQNNIKHPS